MIRGRVKVHLPKQGSILFRHLDIPVKMALIQERAGVTMGRLGLWLSCLSKWLALGARFPLAWPRRPPR